MFENVDIPTYTHTYRRQRPTYTISSPLSLKANSKGAEKPAHPRNLISAFVIRCLLLLAIAKISRPQLVPAGEQAGLSLNWSETPNTGFLVTKLITFQLPEVGYMCAGIIGGMVGLYENAGYLSVQVYSTMGYGQGWDR